MIVKTLNDFTDEPCQDVAPDSCEGRKRLKVELREAAKEWLNVFKINREVDQDPEEGIDEAFIRIFFNLEDYDK